MVVAWHRSYPNLGDYMVFVGTEGKAVLRGEGNTWAPVSWSFDKLREVGVSPYLDFTLYLSVFQCFG